MVDKRCPYYGRFKIVFTNILKWFFSINKRTNTVLKILFFSFESLKTLIIINTEKSKYTLNQNMFNDLMKSKYFILKKAQQGKLVRKLSLMKNKIYHYLTVKFYHYNHSSEMSFFLLEGN